MNSLPIPDTTSLPAPLKSDLTRLAGLRCRGVLNEPCFERAVQQFAERNVQSCGLLLLTRRLGDGRTRFVVKEPPTGRVCYLMDFGA